MTLPGPGVRCFTWLVLVLLSGCNPQQHESAVSPDEAVSASYTGDESCASCHEDVYASYKKTGMGRSVSLFDPATAPEKFTANAEVYNARFDYYYAPFVQNDTLFQREYRKDSAGKIIHERVHPAAWVIGSGNATRSYLMNVNGHVTQMPLTWYVDKQRWDLSPAYEQQNFRFERPITQECMTCHNATPAYSPFTQNHYTNVPLGISCERCHGPGSEHVDIRLAGLGADEGEVDPTIVNPAHLDRALQLSVCQQCHLAGATVFGPGEDMSTFRPGALLDKNRDVFVIEEQLADPEQFGIASHAQRLAMSACFQESEMTCVTCHNPHEPVAALDEDHFNKACLGCHTPAAQINLAIDTTKICNRDVSAAPDKMITGNCIGCHLQKSGTSDIPHVTFTDHWIRKTVPPARLPTDINRDLTRQTPFKLVRVESETPAGDAQQQLEEAIAYFNFYDTEHRHPGYLPDVIKKARTALRNGAEHAEGRLVLARALINMDSLRSASAVLSEALQIYPAHARLQYWLGETRMRLQDTAGATAAFKRSVEIAPAFLEARVKLASAYSAAQKLAEAEGELLQVIAGNPVHLPEAWNNLGFIYLQTERLEAAGRMFDRAVGLDPDLATAWANAGTVHLMQQEIDLAAQDFERALTADPTMIAALGNLSLVYRQQGKIAQARDMLRRLLTFQPDEPNAKALLKEMEGL